MTIPESIIISSLYQSSPHPLILIVQVKIKMKKKNEKAEGKAHLRAHASSCFAI